MSLRKAQLKRMAEILRVDELVEFGTLSLESLEHGFGIRVGDLTTRVVIDEPILSTRDPARALDTFTRALFAAARDLRARAEQAERRDALRAFVGSAQAVVPASIEFVPLSMPTSKVFDFDGVTLDYKEQAVSSALGLSREQLGISSDNPKPANRFAAIALELEDL